MDTTADNELLYPAKALSRAQPRPHVLCGRNVVRSARFRDVNGHSEIGRCACVEIGDLRDATDSIRHHFGQKLKHALS